MGVVEDLADNLARDVLDAMKRIEDDRFYEKVSKVIGASSPTLQEAFLTAVRIRMAEERGRKFLEDTVTKLIGPADTAKTPKADSASSAQRKADAPRDAKLKLPPITGWGD